MSNDKVNNGGNRRKFLSIIWNEEKILIYTSGILLEMKWKNFLYQCRVIDKANKLHKKINK